MVILNSQRIRCWLCWLPIGPQSSYAAVQKAGGVGQCSLLGERLGSPLDQTERKIFGARSQLWTEQRYRPTRGADFLARGGTPRSASERATGLSSTAWGPTSMWQ